MALIAQADLEARLKRSLSSEEASAFTLINAALQAQVERIIGSDLEAVELSTRYYDGGKQHTPIDPCTDVESVKLVGDDQVATYTYANTDYTLEPINRTIKTMVRHRSAAVVRGINSIAVRAKFSIWGDEKTRNIIKDAMLDSLISEVGSADNVKRESIEGYSIEYASPQTQHNLSRISYLFPRI